MFHQSPNCMALESGFKRGKSKVLRVSFGFSPNILPCLFQPSKLPLLLLPGMGGTGGNGGGGGGGTKPKSPTCCPKPESTVPLGGDIGGGPFGGGIKFPPPSSTDFQDVWDSWEPIPWPEAPTPGEPSWWVAELCWAAKPWWVANILSTPFLNRSSASLKHRIRNSSTGSISTSFLLGVSPNKPPLAWPNIPFGGVVLRSPKRPSDVFSGIPFCGVFPKGPKRPPETSPWNWYLLPTAPGEVLNAAWITCGGWSTWYPGTGVSPCNLSYAFSQRSKRDLRGHNLSSPAFQPLRHCYLLLFAWH